MTYTEGQMMLIESRVQRGVNLLNINLPGWRELINAEELDMISLDKCVLGQLYGDYTLGIKKLKLNLFAGEGEAETTLHGFGIPVSYQISSYTKELESEWKKHLTQ